VSRTQVLCALDEIEDGGAKGFSVEDGEGERLEIFVIREGRALYAYENACPHIGTPLDWTPDRFLDAAGENILCATHGALFRIEDGYCTAGPCAGDRLSAFEVILDAEERVVFTGRKKRAA
jgi:nitrite reductase/ring-hydroxylating ferredoxin subunit